MKIMAALDLSDYADFVLIKAIKTAKQQNAKMDIVVVAEEHSNESDSAEWERANEKLLEDTTRAAQCYQQKALAQDTHGIRDRDLGSALLCLARREAESPAGSPSSLRSLLPFRPRSCGHYPRRV